MESDDQERLERNLRQAWHDLSGAASRAAQGTENKYGQAYQELVRAGLRPQLKRKYRVSKG